MSQNSTDQIYYRSVRFTPTGEENETVVSLQPDAPMTISAGTKPDVNSFIVPYTEYDSLIDDKGELKKAGKIEIFWKDDQAAAVTLKDQTLVRVDAVRRGKSIEVEGGSTIEVDRVLEYRLYFADFRARFQSPRGGRLMKGLLNPDPSRLQSAPGLADPTPKPNSELITICFAALGGATLGPLSADAFYPPQNLEWYGAHPFEELEKILKGCMHVFCPSDDYTKFVQPIGTGDEPNIPDGQELPALEVPGVDRRGKTIIVLSAPTAVIDTWIWPPSGTTSTSSWPTWDYVVREHAGSDGWIKIADSAVFENPVAAINNGFNDYPKNSPDVVQFNADAYTYLHLDPVKYPPQHCPLRQFLIRDADVTANGVRGTRERLKLMTKGAVPMVGGGWTTAASPTEMQVDWMLGNRIHAGYRIGKLNTTPARDLDSNFHTAICNTDFGVCFSVEAWDHDRQEKKYFRCGFRKNLDTLEQLPDSEVLDLLDGKDSDDDDVVVLRMPELQLVIQNGIDDLDSTTSLRAKLTAKAKARVQQILDADSTVKQRVAVGLIAGEISGKVSKITYDFDACQTIFDLNDWSLPGGAITFNNTPKPGETQASTDAAYSSQQYANGSVAPKPSVPLQPSAPVQSNLPKIGTYQYTVYSMVADNVDGWDYPRAHEP